MEKKYLGQLLTLKFEYTDEIVEYSGYLLDFNDDWVLLKYNKVDYVVDGYVVLRNKYVSHFKRDSREKFTQKILDLKGQKPKDNEKIPITDLETILTHLSKKFGLFQFSMRVDNTTFVGKVKKITGADLKIDYLTPRATWTNDMPPFKLGNIRSIQFDNDYVNSLKLIAKKKR
ncbi:MAG TPA: hypothetical protein VIU12_16255 [Chryseolinea sp.]